MITPALDFKLMAVFLSVLDTRSVSGAALHIGMSQPGLSTALRRLREQLGDPLFVRTSAGMEPTVRARELEEPIRAIMRLLTQKVLATQQFDPAVATNEFRIAMSDMGEYGLLPPIMAAVRQQAPHVRITSVSPRFDEIERALESGEIDLVLGYFPDLKSASIVETVILHGTFACFVGPNNPMANQALTMDQFSAAGHILVEPIGRSQDTFENFLQSRGIRRNIVVRTSHIICVPQILAKTDLIAAMPVPLGQAQNVWGAEPVGLPFELPTTAQKMYWHRIAHEDAGHQWLRQLVSHELKALKSFKAPLGPAQQGGRTSSI
jgi:DNA-binding transcriptional LysR family regulator